MKAFAVAALVVATAATAQVPGGTLPGWTYAYKATVDSGGGKPPRVMETRMQTSSAGTRMTTAGEQFAAMGGAYSLIDSAGTITSILPEQRVVMTGGSLSVFASMIHIRLLGSPRVVETRVGAGEALLGHPTRRTRLTSDYDTRVTFLGDSCDKTVHTETEAWIATDVEFPAAMNRALTSMMRGAQSDSAMVDLARRSQGMAAAGAALRVISKTRQREAAESTAVTTTLEATELTQGSLDAALFRVPEDFQKMDMNNSGMDMRAMLEGQKPMFRKLLCASH